MLHVQQMYSKMRYIFYPLQYVQICTVSDTLHALQHPPPVRSARRGLSGIECRPVQRAQRPGVLWLRSPPEGYTAAALPSPVSLSTTEKIKKAQKITPAPIVNLKNSASKTKRPLQRVCVLCYTCLTSLEREESVK